MSTMANTVMVLRHPKDAVRYPARAPSVSGPADLQRWAEFFAACGGGFAPGAPGETRIEIARGSTDAAPARAYQKVTLASVAAATVFEVNGVPFTALSGTATAGNNEFDISGTDAADATALAASVNASTTAGVAGVVQAGNLAGTIQCASVVAGDYVTIGGRKFLATSYPTGRVGEFSILGNDTADATALKNAINADPWLSRQCFAESSTDTVTVRQYVGTTGLAVAASAATFTLGGLSSGKLAAVAVVVVSALQLGVGGNAVTVKTQGLAATGTVTYVTPSGTQTIVINGVTVYNATAGATATLTAAAAAAAINASTDALVATFVRAVSRAGVVHIFAKEGGLLGNSITLAATGTGATASVARLAGGTVASHEGVQASGTVTLSSSSGNLTATINGVDTTVAFSTDDATSAALLAAAINSSTDALVRGHVYASSSAGVVTITAIRGGLRGNSITLAATGTGATASGARLASGAAPTTVVPAADRLANGVGGDATSPVVFQF